MLDSAAMSLFSVFYQKHRGKFLAGTWLGTAAVFTALGWLLRGCGG